MAYIFRPPALPPWSCVSPTLRPSALPSKNSLYGLLVLGSSALLRAESAFALGICIGSTHAFGAGDSAYPNTFERLKQLVRPGGYLLIGEGYWKQEPAPEYLAFIGDPVGIYRDHAGNISFA